VSTRRALRDLELRDRLVEVARAEACLAEHPNLFLVGSAVFPTGGVSNPTLTIAALALRAAGTIRQDLTAAP
jgi:glucose dehydrogenase